MLVIANYLNHTFVPRTCTMQDCINFFLWFLITFTLILHWYWFLSHSLLSIFISRPIPYFLFYSCTKSSPFPSQYLAGSVAAWSLRHLILWSHENQPNQACGEMVSAMPTLVKELIKLHMHAPPMLMQLRVKCIDVPACCILKFSRKGRGSCFLATQMAHNIIIMRAAGAKKWLLTY